MCVNVCVQVADWVRSWTVHNPSFHTWFWTDSAVRRLLDSNFSAWLVDLYDSYPMAINRADLRKYLVLYAVGGVVADLDVQCLRPLSPLLDWLQSTRHGCVLSEEPELHREFLYPAASQPYVSTAIITCTARHPFVDFVLRLLPKYASNAQRLPWNDNVLNSTGPTFLSAAVRLYRSQTRTDRDDLLIVPSRWFTPTYDPRHTTRFQTLCAWSRLASRPVGCDDVAHNEPFNDSYTTHHWLHSWADGFVAGPRINVSRLTTFTRLIV